MQKRLLSSLYDILFLAVPMSLSRLLNVSASFIAMMMVASLGKKELAAGSLAISSYIAILTLTATIFYAIGIRIRYQAHKTPSPVTGILIKNGLWLALLLSIPSALILFYMDKVLLIFGLDPQIVSLTKDYFFYAGWGMFPLLIVTVIVQFYLGIGKPYLSFLVELINFPLIILASYAFVLGHFGFPTMGLAGVGLAMLAAHCIMLGAIVLIVFLQKHHLPYQIFTRPFWPNWQCISDILKFGLPIGIQFGGELIAMAVSTYLMGYFGVNALAALQITSQYSIIIFMLNFGVSQALALKISEELGKHNLNGARNYVYASLILIMIYTLPVILLFCTVSNTFAEFYMGKTTFNEGFEFLIKPFFALSAAFLFFDGIRNLLSAALRGFHDAKVSTRINLPALWFISLPLSWLLAFPFNGGPIGLRIGFLSGFIIAALLLSFQLNKKLKKEFILPHFTKIADAST